MKYKTPKKRSTKKKLRDECGKLHLALLKKLRNNNDRCEICGKRVVLGRFHIISVGQLRKAEFLDDNVLLTGWFCCHYAWHHYGGNHPKTSIIADKIKRLCGEDYETKIRTQAKFVSTLNEDYYRNLIMYFKQELNRQVTGGV